MRFLLVFAFLLILSFCFNLQPSFAEVSEGFTEYEVQSLPDLIELKLRAHFDYAQGIKNSKYEALAQKYIDKYGWGYQTLHHYGKGLIYLDRYYKNQKHPSGKEIWLKWAIGEFSFTLEPGKVKSYTRVFILTFLPSIYYKRGEAYLLSNNFSMAINDFSSVIKIRPTYYKAYLSLSECYRRIGDNENAEKILLLGKQRAKDKK